MNKPHTVEPKGEGGVEKLAYADMREGGLEQGIMFANPKRAK